MSPLSRPRLRSAMVSASATSSVRMWLASAQPTTRRDDRSMTVAKYAHPSPVAM